MIEYGERTNLLSKGSVVGELAMVHNIPRSFSVICLSSTCRMLKLARIDYNKLTEEYRKLNLSEGFQILSHSTLFEGISKEALRKLEGSYRIQTYHRGNRYIIIIIYNFN